MIKIIGRIGAVLFCAAVIAAAWYFTSGNNADNILIDEVVIEAGSQINIADFFSECPEDAAFLTDVSGIDTDVPAVYSLKVFYNKHFEKDVVLRIEDRTAPQGVAVPQSLYSTWKMPDAKKCVDGLYDLSGIAEVKFRDGLPEFKKTGEYEVPVSVTDLYGNSTVIKVPFSVTVDNKAPVLKGLHDFEVGDDPHELDFYTGITVSDDYDKKPVFKVDDSRVNYSKSGEYTIFYRTIDEAGNIGTYKVKIKVTIPGDDEENTGEEEDLEALYYYYTNHAEESYGLAENILDGLWGANDVETARNIFEWVHSSIGYMTINYYQSYEAAAFRGFASRSGDCYVYFSCCKMLLDLAGIPNMMVTRYPVTGNGHFWNLVKLNGEWYHCDATKFMYHPEIFFMCTDDEIDDSHHQFDGYLYPKRAGGSREYKSSSDPSPRATNTPKVTTTPAVTPKVTNTPKVTVTPAPKSTVTPTPAVTVSPAPVPSTDAPTPVPPTDTPTPVPTEVPEQTEIALPTPVDEPEPSADEPVTLRPDEPENTPADKPVSEPEDEPSKPSIEDRIKPDPYAGL